MNIRNVAWQVCPTFVLLMTVLFADSAESLSAPQSRNLPNHLTAPADYHVYTTEEMIGLFRRPESPSELLHNLQIAWDRGLLAQPAFYDDANLKKVFNATAVEWQKQIVDKSGAYANHYGTLTLNTKVFPNTTVRVVHIRHVAKAESHTAIHVDLPAYIEDMGDIEMNAESLAGFTWGTVKVAFGSDAEDQGDDTIYEGFPPPGAKPAGKAWMRYLHPGEDPSRFGSALRPEAIFIIKPDAVYDPSESRRLPRHPKDNDEVKSFRIFDSVTQYKN
jgi:hypothetical protein